jgi:hypothetical protein
MPGLGYSLLRLTVGLNFLFHSFVRWSNLAHFVDGVVAQICPDIPSRLERAGVCIRNPILGASRGDFACCGSLDTMGADSWSIPHGLAGLRHVFTGG